MDVLIIDFIVDQCWVRLGSSTWNVLWSWNNNKRRLRLLDKNKLKKAN